MTDKLPEPIEEVTDDKLEEIKKKPEFKSANTQEELFKAWLEKMQGAGDARYGNQHESGAEEDWMKPVDSETYIGTKGKESDKHE
jgi:vacuolar-type H+-ATPase subunit E/Vma4|tara:strand:+ start:1272 stop:1526 length:255 start_codon:yes stop_codon:yes gene_type:complete